MIRSRHMCSCSLAILVGWKQSFVDVGSRFSKTLEVTIQNLRQSKSLLENEARLLEIEQNQRSRYLQEEQFQIAEHEEKKRQAFTIMEKIQPASSDTDQWKSANRWKSIPSSGRWLLEHEVLQPWLQEHEQARVLWLEGKPGAGEFGVSE